MLFFVLFFSFFVFVFVCVGMLVFCRFAAEMDVSSGEEKSESYEQCIVLYLHDYVRSLYTRIYCILCMYVHT